MVDLLSLDSVLVDPKSPSLLFKEGEDLLRVYPIIPIFQHFVLPMLS
jgi:hypothetical protein